MAFTYIYVCANTPASTLFTFSSERIHDLDLFPSTPQSTQAHPIHCDVIPCTNVYYQLIYALYA